MAGGGCINQLFLICTRRFNLLTGTAPAIIAIGHTGQPSDNPACRGRKPCALRAP